MNVSDQLHSLTNLSPSPISTIEDTQWILQLLWILWRKDTFLPLITNQTLIIQPIFFTKEAISAPSIVHKTDYSFINILILQLCFESTQMARQCSELDDSTHFGFNLLLDCPGGQLFFVDREKSTALIIQGLLATLILINSPIKMLRFSAL